MWNLNSASDMNAVFTVIGSVLVAVSIWLFTLLVSKRSRCMDDEYFTYLVSHVRYYEPWDELKREWVEEEYADGVDSSGNIIYKTRTVLEDVVVEHKAEYDAVMEDGSVTTIDWKMYSDASEAFGDNAVFHDMGRNYHTKDGGMWSHSWNGNPSRCYTITVRKKYRNPVKGSRSIFRSDGISDIEASKEGLYSRMPYTCVYGCCDADMKDIPYVNWEASRLTKECGLRVNYLFFEKKSPEIAERQKQYWWKGSRNEMTVCIGTDDRIVKWCRCFSWSNDRTLELMVEKQVEGLYIADMRMTGDYIYENREKWAYNDLSEYEYLKSDKGCVLACVFSGVLGVLMFFVGVL